MYLRVVYALYKDCHPDNEIRASKFYSLRPPNVLLLSDTPADQCKCTHHENFMFLLKSVNVEYSNDFWESTLCNSENLTGKCWKGKCEACSEGK